MTGDVALHCGQYGPHVCRSLYTLLNVRREYLSQGKGLTTSGSLDAPDCVPAGALGQDAWNKRLILFVKVR